jgi:hypothetical protein
MTTELTAEELQIKQAAIANDKQIVIAKLVTVSTGLQQSLTAASSALSMLRARGYLKGGESEIVESDLLGQQFTAAELHEVIALFGELQKFSMGQAVTAGPWGLVNGRVAG